jgi:excisionase family DNA binding protein
MSDPATVTTVQPDPMMLAARKLAWQLQVSERTIKDLAAAGDIPSYRVGRQLRFNLAEVLSALRARPERQSVTAA